MNCKVRDLCFAPRYHNNHLLKDSFLYVSYDKKIERENMLYKNYDYIVFGWSIIDFLIGCEKYGYDISKIKLQLSDFLEYFKENFPEDYGRLRINTVEEMFEMRTKSHKMNK